MDFGRNIFEWVQEQAMFLGFTAIIILVLFAIFKKASTQLITIIVLGGIGLAIIVAPEKVSDLGQALFRAVFG